ncbi:MAG: TatD family hydrolase [Bacteroidetes bacterium]|nr:TatD family hydrolase [Bacteroidota bacterium]
MIPYINIHTHHLSQEDGVFLFNNRFGFDKIIYTDSFFSAGIHPWDADLPISITDLEQLIQHPNCLAVGECGLDSISEVNFHIQTEIFKDQLDLAVNYQKPVMIHCVRSFDELIAICEPYHSSIPLIIHGFNKSIQLAQQLIHKGFYLSLSHAVFKKNNIDMSSIPVEKLFLETDDRNTVSIKDVYKSASLLLKIDEDVLKEKIYSNFTTLFK